MMTTNSAPAPAPQLFHGDLPADVTDAIIATGSVAIDTETMGLSLMRDRLCLVQMATADGAVTFVKFAPGPISAPNLGRLLADPSVIKLFHFGRFDIAQLQAHTGVMAKNVYCTKIASKLVRTFTERHGLKDLVRDYLGTEISKQQQTSDWGAPELTGEQLAYAANDVLFLHGLKTKFDALLEREGRTALAQACFDFLPTRAALDVAGWPEIDIFAHS